jgi:hypothetical protein
MGYGFKGKANSQVLKANRHSLLFAGGCVKLDGL